MFRKEFASKIARERWPKSKPNDIEVPHPRFEFESPGWRERVTFRCQIEQIIKEPASGGSGDRQCWYEETQTVLDLITQNEKGAGLYDGSLLEGLRWIAEMFDEYVERGKVYEAQPAPISILVALGEGLLKRAVQLYRLFSCQENVFVDSGSAPFEALPMLKTLVKAIGVLAHNEKNRKLMGSCGLIHQLIQLYDFPNCDETLLNNVLWALVVSSRPVGAAAIFHARHTRGVFTQAGESESFPNVTLMQSLIGSPDIGALKLLQKHRNNPNVIAKVLWMFVNFSLREPTKQYLCQHGVIEMCMDAIHRFGDNQDLCYRAMLACANLCIRADEHKRVLYEKIPGENTTRLAAGIQAMERFPEFESLQKSGVYLIRSLIAGGDDNSIGSDTTGSAEKLIEANAPDTLTRLNQWESSDNDTRVRVSWLAGQSLFWIRRMTGQDDDEDEEDGF